MDCLSASQFTVGAHADGSPLAFDDCVFVNCPFDRRYEPLLRAMLFAIHDCGFTARLAL